MGFDEDKIFRTLIIGVMVCFSAAKAGAQPSPDSVNGRTMLLRSPRGAMIRSAILPGLGQVYNRKWFKAAIVFGTEAALAGNAVLMNQKMLASESADERDYYEYYRGSFVWWFVGVYLLNILDAYVDAQLSGFDIEPELGPPDEGSSSGISVGMRVTVGLGKIM
jgi:hypothetical protein